jgi:hypothetical protein
MGEHDAKICVNEVVYCGGRLLLLGGVVLSFGYRFQAIVACREEAFLGWLFFPAS